MSRLLQIKLLKSLDQNYREFNGQLFKKAKVWNKEKFQRCLLVILWLRFLTIPIFMTDMLDKVIWKFSSNEKFSTKNY